MQSAGFPASISYAMFWMFWGSGIPPSRCSIIMPMLHHRLCIVVAGGVAAAIAIASVIIADRPLFVNGRKAADPLIEHEGKSYVSLDSLKAAGAGVTVASDRVSLQFVPLEGREQMDAVEGVIGEWVENEGWRLRVDAVEPVRNPFGRGPGYKLKLTLANLGARAVSPFATGMDRLQLIDPENVILSSTQASFKNYFQAVPPGANVTEEILFGDPGNALTAVGPADKLLVLFRQTGGRKWTNFRFFLRPD